MTPGVLDLQSTMHSTMALAAIRAQTASLADTLHHKKIRTILVSIVSILDTAQQCPHIGLEDQEPLVDHLDVAEAGVVVFIRLVPHRFTRQLQIHRK